MKHDDLQRFLDTLTETKKLRPQDNFNQLTLNHGVFNELGVVLVKLSELE